jgi:exodeoxyribonuclease-1
MGASYFFYDLETSGFNPREARVMQFAGQRTDMELNPIGEEVNVLIKLTPDVLPDPDAVLITGITPQQTLADGLTEAEFLKYFYDEVVQNDTIFLGYNSVRFDDEFMRYLHYRNFCDAYEWQWNGGCSRWDLLDVVRMTRALRPEGIEWPFAPDGKPANRLEYLTKVNKLDHYKAHDAMSDVHATIAVAKLIRTRQKELFEYLLNCRKKDVSKELVMKGQPFAYTSGRYPGESLHTTAAVLLTPHNKQDSALVYDLRHDPVKYLDMSVEELADCWRWKQDSTEPRLPVKNLKYNRCPAVAPLGVIKDSETWDRLGLSLETVQQHWNTLRKHQTEFARKVHAALDSLDAEREAPQTTLMDDELTVDGRLYENFFDRHDKELMRVVRGAEPAALSSLNLDFHDDRLNSLLPLYKARNYPASLGSEERALWDNFIQKRLFGGGKDSRVSKYFERLKTLADSASTDAQRYLLEELRLYGESVVPAEAAA